MTVVPHPRKGVGMLAALTRAPGAVMGAAPVALLPDRPASIARLIIDGRNHFPPAGRDRPLPKLARVIKC